MVTFRTYNDIVASFLESLRLTTPDLDTKPGTVARDLFIDAPSTELAEIYNQLRNISSLQSFFSTSGTDLERLGSNFGVSKIPGARSTGVAVLTTDSLELDILITSDTIFTARNGVTFRTTTNTVMSSNNSNVYRANASRLRSDLNLAGITDEFAIEVNVEAVTVGTGGNISRFSLTSQNVPGINNITNLSTFSGGSNAESDAAYRNRILSVFAGSNTGTALGYETAISTNPNVSDVEVVVPGDPLLTRDGTETSTDVDGNLIVSDPGTGGKVDIYVLGQDLESNIDSFIYNDQSGQEDPTDASNDVILGQQGTNPDINTAQRRVTLLANNTLPFQPVDNVVSVSGSLSGGNFIEKFTDERGQTRGNFELVKDTGSFGGSPFGFDKLSWISNEIDLDDETITKGVFNGTDALNFTDINLLRSITQDILITNENASVSSDNRSSLQLKHSPIRTVSRVINLGTGERYTVSDQNPDGNAGTLNTTGRILISGNTLPTAADTLQVDYTWVKPFDNLVDFDNLNVPNRFRTVQDSVDWSYSNLVKYEPSVTEDAYGDTTIEVTHDVSKVVEVTQFSTETVTVTNNTVILSEVVNNVIDMKRVSDGAEVYNTDLANGSLSGTTNVILPTDTIAEDGDSIVVRFNTSDLFSADGYDSGSFDGSIITMPDGIVGVGRDVLVTYVANVQTLLPATDVVNLPATRDNNDLVVNDEVTGKQPSSYRFNSDDEIIQSLRFAPSNVRVSAASIGGSGSIRVSGTTSAKISDALVVITGGDGLTVDLSSAIEDALGLSSVPNTVAVSRLESVELVQVDTDNLVTSVDLEYDTINYKIRDNSQDLTRALKDTSLSKNKIALPQTTTNSGVLLSTGDIVRVTFYYTQSDDSETLFYSKNGTQITNKRFQTINRISLASGFVDSTGAVSGSITVTNLNQPRNNTVYEVDYSYTAPKENERITVTFNTNNVIRNSTTALESVRPITADVLVKAAVEVPIDVNIRIVKTADTQLANDTIIQNATDAISSFLNATSLGTTVDASDITNTLYTVEGIDRVRIINFSTEDGGNVLSITAENNEYLQAATINVEIEER